MVKYLFFFSIVFLFQCPGAVNEYILEREMVQELLTPIEKMSSLHCNSNEAYVPDTILKNVDPVKEIRMNIHFMNDSKGDKNYDGPSGIKYAEELIFYANRKLVFNKQMSLPEDNDTPVFDPKYQYVLTPIQDDGKDKGIYFHYDDSLYYYVNEGKRNNYNKDVINKYAVGKDSILNVFYMVHHADSIKSRSYSASASGIALGKSLKLGTKYNPKDKPWHHASLLNHEVGHVLGLSHTWNLNDGCDDTPKNANCWSPSNKPPCDGAISNNMMDYNSNQHAITPCQIGKMRKNMAKNKSKQRDLVIKNWCDMQEGKDVIIGQDYHFSGAKDLEGNLIILPGATLSISCRLSMPAGGEIIVNPGAKLILNGARIHNDCGKEWKGIKVLKKGGKIGQVFYKKSPSIEDTKNDFFIEK